MSTIETYYCNTTTDLLTIVPGLDGYDSKRIVTNWSVHSGSVYRADSIGYIAMLYQGGRELGAGQSALIDVDATDEWYFDSAEDVVYFYSTTDPNELSMEAGEDWAGLKLRKVQEQAERIRSYVPFPILPRKGVGTESASSREYDWIIINANSTLACAELVRPYDSELSLELEKRIIDPETELGTLDLLKKGEYQLWNQGENQDSLRSVSVNASTTSSIVDVKGNPSAEWDIIKIIIDTGGTLSSGSSSSIKYSTYGRDETGIKILKIVDDETVTGGWDYVGHGMYVRFSAGVLTTNDEWELEVSGMRENPSIKTAKLWR